MYQLQKKLISFWWKSGFCIPYYYSTGMTTTLQSVPIRPPSLGIVGCFRPVNFLMFFQCPFSGDSVISQLATAASLSAPRPPKKKHLRLSLQDGVTGNGVRRSLLFLFPLTVGPPFSFTFVCFFSFFPPWKWGRSRRSAPYYSSGPPS